MFLNARNAEQIQVFNAEAGRGNLAARGECDGLLKALHPRVVIVTDDIEKKTTFEITEKQC